MKAKKTMEYKGTQELEQALSMAIDSSVNSAPYVVFANALIRSKRTLSVGELAKVLRENGCKDMTKSNLLEWLKKSDAFDENDTPKPNYIKGGFFEVTTYVRNKNGVVCTTSTAKVTGLGQMYIINYFMTRI